MVKRVLFLLLLTVFSLVYLQDAAAAQRFRDVGDHFWAKAEIDYLVNQGIIRGYADGNFGVNDPITRLQAAVMIGRATPLDLALRHKAVIRDLPETTSEYPIVAAIVEKGIMQLSERGEFRPSAYMTRAEMAVALVKAFRLQGTSAYSFRDLGVTHWARDEVGSLLHHHIIAGYPDNTFRPDETLTRAQFAVMMARVMHSDFRQSLSCYRPDNQSIQVVNVAAATLWSQPQTNRPIDQPAVSNPVDLRAWTKQLNKQQKLWLVGKIETQALYNQQVVILQDRGEWLQIAVKDQFTTKHSSGYPGWVPQSQISTIYPNYQTCDQAIVKKQTSFLYHSKSEADKFMELSFDTRLPVVKKEAGWIQVHTPHNQLKWLRAEDVRIVASESAIPKPARTELVDTAKTFLGLPYLWAGTSGFGFDCSGFTHTIYKHHGIMLARDSAEQFKQGTAVAKNNLLPGDLLFFAYNQGKGRIHHVSMYIGNGQMIHSPQTGRTVEIISIDTEPYASEFAGARRYLTD